MFNIDEELKKLPNSPGVYLMKNDLDQIIYVGKAKILKNRVKQYFQNNGSHTTKTVALVSNISYFEYIVTDSELEALILECNLIKKYKPKYNILLKDSKTYPYIKITMSELFPKIQITRMYKKDKNKYFGPFVDVGALNEVMDLIEDMWQVRSCSLKFPRDFNKNRPCLNYHIGKCKGPCNQLINEEDYNKIIEDIINFLSGNTRPVILKLENQMKDFSSQLEFEKAGVLRDKIDAIRRVSEKQKITNVNENNQDVIGFSTLNGKALFQIYLIRNGKMLGREQHFIDVPIDFEKNIIMEDFLNQYYKETTFVPKSIVLENKSPDMDLIEMRLSNIKGSNVHIVVPQKGEKLRLLKLANQNAELSIVNFGKNMEKEHNKTLGAMKEITDAIGLLKEVKRIEAYDISNTSGSLSVGSMIVFENGKQKPSDYRKFKIKGVVGPNDYESIEEVIGRRFNRYFEEQKEDNIVKKFSTLPDLLLIDGGKGQVSSAKIALSKFNLNIPVAGMIKDDSHKTRGLLYEGSEILIKGEGFKLLTRIQDEVHRFAISYHKKLRAENQIKSSLDNISGIGSKRRTEILKYFGGVEKLKTASIEEILLVPKMTKPLAEKIFNYYKS